MKKAKPILLIALLCAPVITRAVTVITSLPYVISTSGEYELKNILAANGTDGIDVNASNVSINLAGHTIIQTQTSSLSTGISVSPNLNNVSIQNGTITGFYYGVNSQHDSSGLVLKNVQILGVSTLGVYVQSANNCLIENCFILGTSGAEKGIWVTNSSNVLIKYNQISEIDAGEGILVQGQSANTLIGNCEANCAVGLELDSSKYQGNITTNCAVPVSGGTAVGQENG